jgi:(1->4)-alpha-D-glucan 1-alpha-D-glucosylmutase
VTDQPTGDPGTDVLPPRPASVPDELHRRLAARRGHPLNATSTHDTKRSEDVRMRVSALSELAGVWVEGFDRWGALNGRHRLRPDAAPDAGEEWLLYQTLVGVWPLDPAARVRLPERMRAFMVKAAREAKTRTSWLDPDDAYESDLRVTVEGLFADADLLTDVGRFVDEIAPTGRAVDLGHLLLRCTMPGVPDLYQGSEDELLSLVDPDNRRPVDPAVHRASTPRAAVIRAALAVRRGHPDAFGPDGSYEPLDLGDEVIGFVRGGEVATVVPRFGRADVAAVDLPGSWDDRLGDGPVRLLVRR